MKKILLLLILFLNAGLMRCQTADNASHKDLNSYSRLEQLFSYIEQLNTGDYQYYLDSLKSSRQTDYFALRMSYTKTEKFAPVSEQTSDLFNLANLLIEKGRLNDALVEIKKILTYDYVNLRAHLLEAYLYDKLKDKPNSEYHNSVYEGLIQSIMEYGDGQNPQTAFIVISMDEIYSFLTAGGYTTVQQESVETAGHYFDKIRVCHKKTDKEMWLYFCTDIPVKKMFKLK